MASSLNFALKSSDEQAAIIGQFQNFLNSLNFSVQICVQSRRLQHQALSRHTRKKGNGTDNRPDEAPSQAICRIRQDAYRKQQYHDQEFLCSDSLYAPSFWPKKGNAEDKNVTFKENIGQLEQRVAVVEEGLTRCGIRMVELENEELIELFYKSFNPGEIEKPIHTK